MRLMMMPPFGALFLILGSVCAICAIVVEW